ncbi:POK10 protein, partial [Balaeniceps rex]|nr:POK10 protein [Balaeniceps rex]
EIWQTDVTHYAPFGRLRYVYVSIDTFSGAICASAHAGEKGRDVCRHWTRCFATLVIPKLIKTDNGPGYISQSTSLFLQQWGIEHVTGIPHNPTGQAIIE